MTPIVDKIGGLRQAWKGLEGRMGLCGRSTPGCQSSYRKSNHDSLLSGEQLTQR